MGGVEGSEDLLCIQPGVMEAAVSLWWQSASPLVIVKLLNLQSLSLGITKFAIEL